jgi:adenylate cyclase
MTDPRPRGILLVDISGSTQLYEQLGDALALARVETCLRLLQRVVEEYDGRVVKTMGDGVMADFAETERALQAARRMQLRIFEQRALGGPTLGIHVGCHWGPAIESGGDLYGDAINVAARVAGLAKVGQIIVTQDAVAQVASRALQEKIRLLDRVAVKGKREPLEIHELVWQDSDELTMIGTRLTEDRPARLRVAFGGREVWFDGSGAGTLSLGRDATCDIVVDDPKASRQHALIERRRDKFVLVDHSSNGTYVRIAGEDELALRREELILRGAGRIALGLRTDDPQATVMEFLCA